MNTGAQPLVTHPMANLPRRRRSIAKRPDGVS
jgi:hypothetical protein